MKQAAIILIILATVASGCRPTMKKQATDTTQVTCPDSAGNYGIDNALVFINSYVDKCNNTHNFMNNMEWVYSSRMTTGKFNSNLKKMIDEAYRDDPELGLGADPLFDAQDYSGSGFELDSFDKDTGYLTVKGKDRAEFKVTIKTVKENGKWLVDGCGTVNIPDDFRAKR